MEVRIPHNQSVEEILDETRMEAGFSFMLLHYVGIGWMGHPS